MDVPPPQPPDADDEVAVAPRLVRPCADPNVEVWYQPQYMTQPVRIDKLRSKSELYRLQTFDRGWPDTAPLRPVELAENGFYYTGLADRVKCAFCYTIVIDWAPGDRAVDTHTIRADGSCPFISGMNVGNIRIDTIMTEAAQLSDDDDTEFLNRHRRTENHKRRCRSEQYRLQTFAWGWPETAPVSPQELANSGFYYLGNLDRVRCVFCDLTLRDWDRGDIADNEHMRHSGNMCPFLLETDVGNIPINPPESSEVRFRSGRRLRQAALESSVITKFGISNKRPMYFDMAIRSVRQKSFCKWPKADTHDIRDVADAGFFYTGFADNCVCFFCSGMLTDWEDFVDPWEKHARQFPQCGYLKSCKGPEYIRRVREQHTTTHESKQCVVQTSPQIQSEVNPESAVGDTNGRGKDDIESLQVENQRLKDQLTCKVCMDTDATIAFLPCGHVTCCAMCSPAMKECPICRTVVMGTISVFLT